MAVNLPIHISQEELQENPGFASLLLDLSTNHLTKEGVSKEKADKLDYCTLSLQKEKKLYLQSLLYYTAINDLVLDHKLNSSAAQEDGKFYDMLSRALNTAEAGMVLQDNLFPRLDPTTLSEFQIGSEDDVKQQIKILGTKLLPKLEAYMEDKLITIAEFHEPTNNKKELQLAKGLQLGDVVANKKQQVNLLSQAVRQDILHNSRAFWEYYKVLESVATSLYSLIQNYKLRENAHDKSNPDPYILTAEWQYVRLQTLKLKLDVVEQQLAEETYGEREAVNPVEGLSEISAHLKQAIEQARWAHEKAIARRSQYESVGLGFSDLASEYGKLLKAIANKEWAIRELDMQ